MPDWAWAFVYAILTCASTLYAIKRASPGDRPFVIPLIWEVGKAVAAGVLIGNWWAPALGLLTLPLGTLANQQLIARQVRTKPLTRREAATATLLEVGLIALGCALRAVV